MKKYLLEVLLRSGVRVVGTNFSEEQFNEIKHVLHHIGTNKIEGNFNIVTKDGISYCIPWGSVEMLSYMEIGNGDDEVEQAAAIYYPEYIGDGVLESSMRMAMENISEQE